MKTLLLLVVAPLLVVNPQLAPVAAAADVPYQRHRTFDNELVEVKNDYESIKRLLLDVTNYFVDFHLTIKTRLDKEMRVCTEEFDEDTGEWVARTDRDPSLSQKSSPCDRLEAMLGDIEAGSNSQATPFLPTRICSRTRVDRAVLPLQGGWGRSNPPATSRCGRLLPSAYADVHALF